MDLRARVSNDNGATWEDITTVIAGKGKDSPDFMNVGFGDPSIVTDRRPFLWPGSGIFVIFA